MDGHKLIIEFKIKMTPCLISLKASDQYGLTNVTNRLEMRKIFFNSSYEPSGTYNIVSNQFNCQVHLYVLSQNVFSSLSQEENVDIVSLGQRTKLSNI